MKKLMLTLVEDTVTSTYTETNEVLEVLEDDVLVDWTTYFDGADEIEVADNGNSCVVTTDWDNTKKTYELI